MASEPIYHAFFRGPPKPFCWCCCGLLRGFRLGLLLHSPALEFCCLVTAAVFCCCCCCGFRAVRSRPVNRHRFTLLRMDKDSGTVPRSTRKTASNDLLICPNKGKKGVRGHKTLIARKCRSMIYELQEKCERSSHPVPTKNWKLVPGVTAQKIP